MWEHNLIGLKSLLMQHILISHLNRRIAQHPSLVCGGRTVGSTLTTTHIVNGCRISLILTKCFGLVHHLALTSYMLLLLGKYLLLSIYWLVWLLLLLVFNFNQCFWWIPPDNHIFTCSLACHSLYWSLFRLWTIPRFLWLLTNFLLLKDYIINWFGFNVAICHFLVCCAACLRFWSCTRSIDRLLDRLVIPRTDSSYQILRLWLLLSIGFLSLSMIDLL